MDGNLVDYKIQEHDKRLDEHDVKFKEQDEKIVMQDKSIIKLASSIDNLTNKLSSGFSLIKWFTGIFLVELVGFFFFMIKSLF